ncbi:MAG: hypothetical protein GQF41_3794 [Candidatus Rifleibacterium amylolyticum]|nr:MAG: hypothetical protein GQF41_3794 [Candidatus Rifleibacterium amylolyticum]
MPTFFEIQNLIGVEKIGIKCNHFCKGAGGFLMSGNFEPGSFDAKP